DFVVPPLEGFWSQKGGGVIDCARKEDFFWISALRVPDFVKNEDFLWAVGEVNRKKKADTGKAEFMTYEEGLCVQCMHTGPYDDEPGTVSRMNDFILREGYVTDISNERLHHEIYLSDPRRTPPEKLKTVIRHPIRRA
ncbi:MAG: GyrI-like domain-containing protein, partial [Clostridia bacterium]|nr:GyrI-like domain-containing protein [Clostridia bacterium]